MILAALVLCLFSAGPFGGSPEPMERYLTRRFSRRYSQAQPREVWPVWKDSTRKLVAWHKPPAKKDLVKLWHRLRSFERHTRAPGQQNGKVTRNGLAVAHAFLFDFLNHNTGRLDPSYDAIADRACISRRSVHRALEALRSIGFLDWIRRCREVDRDGRYSLEQESNAYQVYPSSAWKGYMGEQDAPPPDAGTWGDHPVGDRDPHTQACVDSRAGLCTAAVVQTLASDEGNRLTAALARLGRHLVSDQGSLFTGVPA